MNEEPTQTPEFNALMGFVLGIIGVIGAFVWYFNSSGASPGLSSGFAFTLGIISFVVLLWSSLAIFFLIRSSRQS